METLPNLYEYLSPIVITGNIYLHRDSISYYHAYTELNHEDQFYEDVSKDRQILIDHLPNGFILKDINYVDNFCSFKIVPYFAI